MAVEINAARWLEAAKGMGTPEDGSARRFCCTALAGSR